MNMYWIIYLYKNLLFTMKLPFDNHRYRDIIHTNISRFVRNIIPLNTFKESITLCFASTKVTTANLNLNTKTNPACSYNGYIPLFEMHNHFCITIFSQDINRAKHNIITLASHSPCHEKKLLDFPKISMSLR